MYGIGARLAIALRAYLEASKQDMKLVPLHEDPKPGMEYTIAGVMRQEDDDWWSFGIGLYLSLGPNVTPKHGHSFRVRIRKSEDPAVCTIATDIFGKTQTRQVPLLPTEDFSSVCQDVYESFVEVFSNEKKRPPTGTDDIPMN
jgi:hypothetical protein